MKNFFFAFFFVAFTLHCCSGSDVVVMVAITECDLTNKCGNVACPHLRSAIRNQILVDMLLMPHNIEIEMRKKSEIRGSCNGHAENSDLIQQTMRAIIQYRSVFRARFEREIADADIGFFTTKLLNNDLFISGDLDFYIDSDKYLSRQIHFFHASDSEYDTHAAKEAIDKVNEFKKKVYEEVRNVAKKYENSDRENWRNKGEAVPESELSNRILQAPYFQALLFLNGFYNGRVLIP